MANLEITNNKTRTIVVWDPVFDDEVVTFTGATTYLAGTILARDTSTQKLIAYVKGGATNGNGIPKAVLLDDLTSTGAGDVPARPVLAASNIDGIVEDELRDFGIIPLSTTQLAELDNQ